MEGGLGEMSSNVDLNDPVVEAGMHKGTSVPENLHLLADVSARQYSQFLTDDGMRGSPIDVDSIEDDVVILSSSARLSQTSNGAPRRKCPATVLLDDDLEEVHPRQTGGDVDKTMRTLSCSNHNKRLRIPRSNVATNNEFNEYYRNSKKNKSKNPQPEPVKVSPQEPAFSCPVCLNQLDEPCSTICGHIFCQSCIKASIKAQKKCPTCRRKLNKNNFHRVYLPTINQQSNSD
ncbi:uncharacterized protein [Typha latifolia]